MQEFLETMNIKLSEAVFLPERWIEVIDELVKFTGAAAGAIGIYWPQARGLFGAARIENRIKPPWETTPKELEIWLDYVRSRNLIGSGFISVSPELWSDIPDLEQRSLASTANGVGPELGTIVELPNGEIITLEVARKPGEKVFQDEFARSLWPLSEAFERAAQFSSRLYFEKAKGTVDVLSTVGMAAALLGSNKQIIAANSDFTELTDYFQSLPNERIELIADPALRGGFNIAISPDHSASEKIVIPATSDRGAAIVQIMPLHGAASDIFTLSRKLVLVTPVISGRYVPDTLTVSKMFRLTPAEAKLAVALASGFSLSDSAAKCAITVGTARSYLLRIFSKTSTNRQSELVGLLKSLG